MTTPLSLKEEGNKRFSVKDYKGAIEQYTQALSLLSSSSSSSSTPTDPEQIKKDNELKTTLYNNRALCHKELFNWIAAVDDASAALSITKFHHKSLFLAATALFRLAKSSSSDQLPQQQLAALHICEVAFKKLDKQHHQSFLPLYKEIVLREKDRYKKTTDSLVHHLNTPNPFLCFVCKAIPRYDCDNENADAPIEKSMDKMKEINKKQQQKQIGENDDNQKQKQEQHQQEDRYGIRSCALGIRCKCTAASFCCVAHQTIADEHHSSICSTLGDLASSMAADDDDFTLPFGSGKDPYKNLDFLRCVATIFCRTKGRRETALEFEQLRQLPRCVGCGYFPARYNCPDCSMAAFCGEGGKCLEKGFKGLTKEKLGGKMIKKQNNHTPQICRALLDTARATHVAYLYPKPSYSTFYTMLDLVAGHMPGRIGMIKKVKVDDQGEDDETNLCSWLIKPEEIMDNCLGLYDDSNSSTSHHAEENNANYLFRKFIAPFKLSQDQLKCQQQEEDAAKNDDTSSSLSFDGLIADSYSWPMSLLFGLFKSCPEEARDRLKMRLSNSNNNNNNNNSHIVQFDQPNTLVIHIVGAENEAFTLPCFEEVMHVLAGWIQDQQQNEQNQKNNKPSPKMLVKNIHLICIGPGVKRISEARKQIATATMRDLCSDCKNAGCSITFHWRSCYYEDYCNEINGLWKKYDEIKKPKNNKGAAASFTSTAAGAAEVPPLPPHPHICVLFNAGINETATEEEGSTWHKGLEAMMLQPACIRIVTCYDIGEAKQDREIIRNVIAKVKKNPALSAEEKQRVKSLVVGEPVKNPFKTPLIKSDPTRWNGTTFGAHSVLFSVY